VDALVSFDCRLISAEKIGTHHICIGEVASVITAHEGEPLLYGLRKYLRPEDH
jgi:flavin reductase